MVHILKDRFCGLFIGLFIDGPFTYEVHLPKECFGGSFIEINILVVHLFRVNSLMVHLLRVSSLVDHLLKVSSLMVHLL